MTDEEFLEFKRLMPENDIFFTPELGGRCALCPWTVEPMDRERGENLVIAHLFEEMKRQMPGATFVWHPVYGGACALCDFTIHLMPRESAEVQIRDHLAQAHRQEMYAYRDGLGNETPLS